MTMLERLEDEIADLRRRAQVMDESKGTFLSENGKKALVMAANELRQMGGEKVKAWHAAGGRLHLARKEKAS